MAELVRIEQLEAEVEEGRVMPRYRPFIWRHLFRFGRFGSFYISIYWHVTAPEETDAAAIRKGQ